jgi:cytoskeletal protein CcmA (bactofilin family)
MKNKILLILAFITLFLPQTLFAGEYKLGNEEIITSDTELKENTYYAANSINFKGVAQQDIFGLAEEIDLIGTTTEDVMTLANRTDISGSHQEDVRSAAAQLYISGDIAGELIGIGSSIKLDDPAEVSGGAMLIGEQINLEGAVNGDSKIYAAREVTINGTVNGDLYVYSPYLQLGKQAKITGNLTYKANQQADIHESSTVAGNIKYNQLGGDKNESFLQGLWTDIQNRFDYSWVYSLLMKLIAALALFGLFKEKIKIFSREAVRNFGEESLRGVLTFLLAPLVIFLLIVTLLGSWLGVIGLLIYLLGLVLANFGGGFVAGQIIGKLYTGDENFVLDWNSMTAGIIVLEIIQQIPYVGWIIYLLVGSVAFGLINKYFYYLIESSNKEA